MPKAVISQPMAGKAICEIQDTRARATKELEKYGFDVVPNLFVGEWYSEPRMKERSVVNIPLCFLAKSLERMSKCDTVYFCKGWEEARGCVIEHEAAKKYGLQTMYEEGASRDGK